jgi:hypothetical protein
MNRLLKIGATLVIGFFAFSNLQAQPAKTVKIDSIHVMGPILIGGNTDFEVRLRVTNLLSQPDSISGDLYYYYLTEFMDSSLLPPRIFLLDSVTEMVTDGMLDTITIDIQPNEIRTTPVNLIILWPALYNAEPYDSISDSIYVFGDGYIGLPPLPENTQYQIVFPCPALQYIYIRPEELNLIRHIQILSMDGKIVHAYDPWEFGTGMINLDDLPNGNYIVELTYSQKTVRTKIIKH